MTLSQYQTLEPLRKIRMQHWGGPTTHNFKDNEYGTRAFAIFRDFSFKHSPRLHQIQTFERIRIYNELNGLISLHDTIDQNDRLALTFQASCRLYFQVNNN